MNLEDTWMLEAKTAARSGTEFPPWRLEEWRYAREMRRTCAACADEDDAACPAAQPQPTAATTTTTTTTPDTRTPDTRTPDAQFELPRIFSAGPLPTPPTRYEDQVTLIIVTSAIFMHPDTSLIDTVLHSACRWEPVLARCRKLIVADHPRRVFDANDPTERTRENEWKSGRFTSRATRAYEEYLSRLEVVCALGEHPYHNAELIRAPRFGGFAMMLKLGLELTTTPFAIVFQHDRAICRSFGMERVLRLLAAQPDRVKYVGLPSNSTQVKTDVDNAMGRFGFASREAVHSCFFFEGAEFVPLVFWYDSTHVVPVRFYLDVIFGDHEFPGTKFANKFRLRTGDFVEDKFGQAMLSYIKLHGMAKGHPRFGTFLMSLPNKDIVVRHCNGRRVGTSRAHSMEDYRRQLEDESFLVDSSSDSSGDSDADADACEDARSNDTPAGEDADSHE